MRAALLILAHGSPREAANEPVHRVAEAVRERRIYDRVQVGFLDCNAPDIPSAIDLCVGAGAERIIAIPYFLHTGNHVAEDLPSLLEDARFRHPGVEFRLCDYLGSSAILTEILATRAAEALSRRR